MPKDLSREDTNRVLQRLSSRLVKAFADPKEHQRLLSTEPDKAQPLLDTLQSILRLGPPEDSRHNFTLTIRKLISTTGLYPRQLDIENIQKLDEIPVASGTHADVWRASYQNKVVCVKTVRVYQTSLYEDVLKTIAREAVFWGQLEHQNLLPFYGIFRADRQMSLVYPWAENGNVVDFCGDIAAGLAYLHENEIIYGSLKGSNVLVDRSHRAYLSDFGLSAVDDPAIVNWANQSVTAPAGGSLRWQAPELFEPTPNKPSGTALSDVYALSCTYYEVFTGRVPFYEYPRDHVVISKISVGTKPKRLTVFTDAIWALMSECWARDPAKRPTSAKVLSRVLTMHPPDRRAPGEWAHGTSTRDVAPMSLEQLEAIVQPGNS
ncbi:hypothetical protein H0H81_012002 [Sphagnurus paluster]|uniref:Protein kinase domain-containing protein n=1 Tax=Sphagnurus paluster TaxID=117069 RepID=A0A9P7FQN2_9AGAR|nr:hypothetical protein H0H81_012002 [Sphagnurus paluster]